MICCYFRLIELLLYFIDPIWTGYVCCASLCARCHHHCLRCVLCIIVCTVISVMSSVLLRCFFFARLLFASSYLSRCANSCTYSRLCTSSRGVSYCCCPLVSTRCVWCVSLARYTVVHCDGTVCAVCVWYLSLAIFSAVWALLVIVVASPDALIQCVYLMHSPTKWLLRCSLFRLHMHSHVHIRIF